MKNKARFCLLGVVLITSGCGTIVVPRDPIPAYVSPIDLEEKDCDQLEHRRDLFGNAVRQLQPRVRASSLNWSKPVGPMLSAQTLRGLNMPADMTLFQFYSQAWGHHDAVMKVAHDQKCGLKDVFGLTPWYSVQE